MRLIKASKATSSFIMVVSKSATEKTGSFPETGEQGSGESILNFSFSVTTVIHEIYCSNLLLRTSSPVVNFQILGTLLRVIGK